MSYRTLEEKFLADFEMLETEKKLLEVRVENLEQKLLVERKNITLDALVRTEGRKKVFGDAVNNWSVPDVGDRDFETWCHVYTYEHALPNGVSTQEFVDYFEDEYVTAFEAKIESEHAE